MRDTEDKKESRASIWSSFFWWRINPEELKREVDEYQTLKIKQSSRGIGFLYLLFVALANPLLNYFAKLSFFWVDGLIFLILGLFVLRGYRWAMVLAMIFWTFEKGDLVYEGIMNNYSYGQINLFNNGSYVILILWWAFFMHMFYKAFRVECIRRKKNQEISTGAILEKPLKMKNIKIFAVFILLALVFVVLIYLNLCPKKSFSLISHGWFVDINELVEGKGAWFKDEPTTIVCRKNLNLCVESTAGVVNGGHLMLDQYYWKVLRWDDIIISKLDMPEVNDNLHWLLCINRKTKQIYKVDSSTLSDLNSVDVEKLIRVNTLQ